MLFIVHFSYFASKVKVFESWCMEKQNFCEYSTNVSCVWAQGRGGVLIDTRGAHTPYVVGRQGGKNLSSQKLSNSLVPKLVLLDDCPDVLEVDYLIL